MWEGLVGVAIVAGVLAWILRGRHAPGATTAPAMDDLTYEEMEARRELQEAEEDVRRRDTGAAPEDEETGEDWGPGTPRAY